MAEKMLRVAIGYAQLPASADTAGPAAAV